MTCVWDEHAGVQDLLQLAGPTPSRRDAGRSSRSRTRSTDHRRPLILRRLGEDHPGSNLVYGDVSKPSFGDNDSDEQIRKHEEDMKQARKHMQDAVT